MSLSSSWLKSISSTRNVNAIRFFPETIDEIVFFLFRKQMKARARSHLDAYGESENNNRNQNGGKTPNRESREKETRVERNKVDLLLSSDDIYKHDVTQLTIKNDSK